MKVLATYNIKGGVGKTSAAVNLAALAAGAGLRTLLWDLDPQGSATFLLRVRPKVRGGARKLVSLRSDVDDALKGTDVEGLDLLPADLSYRHLDLVLDDTKRPERQLGRVLKPIRPRYDLALLDCPPSISLVSESVFEAADALLVPLIPTTLSVRAYDQLRQFLDDRVDRPPAVLAFFSMVDRRKRLHLELLENLPRHDPTVLDVAIPSATDVERMGTARAPVVLTAPNGAAAIAYRELWARVQERLWPVVSAPAAEAAAGSPRPSGEAPAAPGDVHGVVAEALVEAPHEPELDGHGDGEG